MTGLEGLPAPKEWRPTVEDIVANAEAACEEARRHITAQSQDSNAIDTKAAALITIASGLFVLVLSRVHLDTASQYIATGVGLLYLSLGIVCCFQSIRPRGDFSYGAQPSFLATLVPDYPHWSVMQQLAVALGEAREKNVAFLRGKQAWYERALVTAVFVALAAGVMVYEGAA